MFCSVRKKEDVTSCVTCFTYHVIIPIVPRANEIVPRLTVDTATKTSDTRSWNSYENPQLYGLLILNKLQSHPKTMSYTKHGK